MILANPKYEVTHSVYIRRWRWLFLLDSHSLPDMTLTLSVGFAQASQYDADSVCWICTGSLIWRWHFLLDLHRLPDMTLTLSVGFAQAPRYGADSFCWICTGSLIRCWRQHALYNGKSLKCWCWSTEHIYIFCWRRDEKQWRPFPTSIKGNKVLLYMQTKKVPVREVLIQGLQKNLRQNVRLLACS